MALTVDEFCRKYLDLSSLARAVQGAKERGDSELVARIQRLLRNARRRQISAMKKTGEWYAPPDPPLITPELIIKQTMAVLDRHLRQMGKR